ncbi:aspartyl protease family protein [Pontibacter sp. G13]|uniref:aspartyl protease family protein n=1 Tax=Pontibacter sp. G13 TaxID=3074898 RepID=UPI00288BFACC|nr:aspartyl protease family protein [Pontibacter sp. G13]WNJ20314.1 aspartyl protease family protein [Pontibacter sp. G13]
MRTVFTLVIAAFISSFVQAQDAPYSTTVQSTIQALNTQSVDLLNPLLADDFTISGHQGQVAQMILQQIFSQVKDSVLTHTLISETQTDAGFEQRYEFVYEGLGTKEAVFVFNESGLLRSFTPFQMQVKTMSQAQPEAELPQQDSIHIPFTMAGNLIAIQAQLNGETKTFLLDSGAPRVILNAHHLPKSGTASTLGTSQGVNGSISGMNIEEVDEFEWAGIKQQSVEMISMDLSHLETELETEFHGLIGYDFFKAYDLYLDYSQQKMMLIKPEKSAEWLGTAELTVPFELQGHIPVVPVQIGDRTLSMGLDTGAESNLISLDLSDELARRLKSTTTSELKGADQSVVEVQKGTLKSMKIGGRKFKQQTTVFSDISHLNDGYHLQLDGLIGYQVLAQGPVLISFVREELRFW